MFIIIACILLYVSHPYVYKRVSKTSRCTCTHKCTYTHPSHAYVCHEIHTHTRSLYIHLSTSAIHTHTRTHTRTHTIHSTSICIGTYLNTKSTCTNTLTRQRPVNIVVNLDKKILEHSSANFRIHGPSPWRKGLPEGTDKLTQSEFPHGIRTVPAVLQVIQSRRLNVDHLVRLLHLGVPHSRQRAGIDSAELCEHTCCTLATAGFLFALGCANDDACTCICVSVYRSCPSLFSVVLAESML